MRCFRDKRLREFIKENGRKSKCSWCKARGIYVIPIWELGSIFREAAKIYEPIEGPQAWELGDFISSLFQEDWQVFSEKVETASDGLMQKLTFAILTADLHPKDDVDEPNYGGFFCRRIEGIGTRWHERIEKLLIGTLQWQSQNHASGEYLSFSDEQLRFAIDELSSAFAECKIFSRARIHKERAKKERFQLADLAAPSPEFATPGRANRKGEPVLYLASDDSTALAEVRAWKGMAVAVAKVRLNRSIKVIDLRRFEHPQSPFFDEDLPWRLELADLFSCFSEELSRPVLPSEEEILYQSSQHLCDLVRRAGYDGVLYPSAMGHGFNVVVFDPEIATILETKYHRIVEVRHRDEKLNDGEAIYDEMPYDYVLSERKK
ncbi:RES family NAD+ phosphorylase [candidate division KSB1 bacterium]|nr:RES family NAD+ phosphorylase [candidate division KSB1 bacterium]